MRGFGKATGQRVALLLLAGLVLAESGCLAAAAVTGVAAGGSAVYLYSRGEVECYYPADYSEVRSAVLAALTDLNMPLVSEKIGTDATGAVISRTADNDKVEINLEMHPSANPGEPRQTRVGVRIAILGDHALSHRILDQVGAHLAPAPTGGPKPATPAPARSPIAQATYTPQPPQSPPPPLAK